MSASVCCCMSSSLADHGTFLALVPKIELHAQITFNSLKCPATRADKIADCVALGWQWYARLHERGKDVTRFPMVFVYLVVKAVKSGRRVVGMEKSKDVLNE